MAETNVTTIQLSAEKGPKRKTSKTILLQGLSLRDPRIFRQFERAHLVQPCATLATCFFHTSRLEGSSPKTFTSLRYTPRQPAEYILHERSASSTIESFVQYPTSLRIAEDISVNPPWNDKVAPKALIPTSLPLSPCP